MSDNSLTKYAPRRGPKGTAYWLDLLGWLGSYPFESAKLSGNFDFYRKKKFALVNARAEGRGFSCNEFVYGRDE